MRDQRSGPALTGAEATGGAPRCGRHRKQRTSGRALASLRLAKPRSRITLGLVVACLLAATATAAYPAVSSRGAGGQREQLGHEVAEVIRFVETQRGLRFREPVNIQLLDDAEMRRRVWLGWREARASANETSGVLRALGLLPPTADYYTQARGTSGGVIVGLYSFKEKSLFLRGASITPHVRSVLAHELTHALDDQWFDLHRPELDAPAAADAAFGFMALTEGNARRIEIAYRASLSMREQATLVEEEQSIAGVAPRGVSAPVVGSLGGAPYTYGPRLAAAILTRAGRKGLDWAFRNPPITSEQVMFPSEYFAQDRPIPVPNPPADAAPVLSRGALGVELLNHLLAPDQDHPALSLRGWGGDSYVVWTQPGQVCLRDVLVGDTDADTAALGVALRAWAEKQPSATVTRDAQRLVLTSCNRA